MRPSHEPQNTPYHYGRIQPHCSISPGCGFPYRPGRGFQLRQGHSPERAPPVIDINSVDFYYGPSKALHGIHFPIREKLVTAFIGPSGCGKSTLLRCLNRMNDLIDGTRIGTGSIKISGVDIYDPSVDVIELRKRVGMVFQKSNPFPKSIYENVVYGLRLQGVRDKARLTKPSSAACAAPRCGRKSATAFIPAPWVFPAASSSGSASPARLRLSPRSS